MKEDKSIITEEPHSVTDGNAYSVEADRESLEKLDSINLKAASLSHDFNNILTGILGNLSLAINELDPQSRTAVILKSTEKAVTRARDLSMQLQTLEKSGLPTWRKTSVAQLLREISEFMLRGSNCNYQLDIDDDLWYIEAQSGQISQVIDNLLVNAKQAMPEGGTITLEASNFEVTDDFAKILKPGPHVRIRVTDTGPGIPPHLLSKIFEPRFTTKKTGSGLGLSTSASIIINHTGHIRVDSIEGGGTTFTIYLPALKEADPHACSTGKAESKETAEDPSIEAFKGAGRRILIMDDDPMIRQITGDMLQLLGYSVDFAANGEEAQQKHFQATEGGSPFAVIIMDLTIENGLGAKETARIIREKDSQTRLLLASGYSNDPVMNRYHHFGFNGCVTKPYNMKQLGSVLKEILEP